MRSDLPLVSVIMPAYNVEKYISEAIRCILDQTHSHIELLIADDGSADGTRKVIQSFNDKRIRTFHNDVNLGNLKTWNNLMANAKGDFITFQDADDWSDLKRIELQLEEFKKGPELGMVATDSYQVEESGKMKGTISFPGTYAELRGRLPHNFPFICATLMIKASMYKKYGGLHEYFDRIGAADFYWGAKIILENKTITINTPLYYYRYNPNSLSQSSSRNLRTFYSAQVVAHLISQQIESKTDDLEQKRYKELSILEERLAVKYLFWLDQNARALFRALKLIFRSPRQPRSFYSNLSMYLKKWVKPKWVG